MITFFRLKKTILNATTSVCSSIYRMTYQILDTSRISLKIITAVTWRLATASHFLLPCNVTGEGYAQVIINEEGVIISNLH